MIITDTTICVRFGEQHIMMTIAANPAVRRSPSGAPSSSELYLDSADMAMHLRKIELLAEETGLPATQIKIAYEATLAQFRQRATISDYLSILVPKHVKRQITV